MSKPKGKPIEGEIVTPEMLDRVLGKTETPDLPALDALLERFEQLFNSSLEATDLTKPEHWLREFFGGLDARIAIKTERGRAIVELIDVFMGNLDQFEQIEKRIRQIHQERHERHIDRVRSARVALEEQQKLEEVAAKAKLQRQIEEAKAEAEVAKYKKETRDTLREPLPAQVTPMDAPGAPKVDEYERQRQAAQQKRKLEYDLKMDAMEAEDTYQEQLAQRALSRILKAFGEPDTLRAIKRMRIRNLIDNHGIAEELLPKGILELIQEEEYS